MASPAPPPATVPLKERLVRLAKTLQFAWFIGHVCMLASSLRYIIYYLTFKSSTRWARFNYRMAFLSALVTYGIVVYKGQRSRSRQGKPTGILTLITDENVQYLLMAVVWLISNQIPLALLPFVVYSVFHVATYTRSNLIPTINPPPGTSPGVKTRPTGGLADMIGRFIREYYDASMQWVARLEIALWFRILLSAITFQRGSWILMGAYTAFFRARYGQSTFVQNEAAQLSARGDAVFSQQAANPAMRQGWEIVKAGAAKFVELTDMTRYAMSGPGGQAPPKKAQ